MRQVHLSLLLAAGMIAIAAFAKSAGLPDSVAFVATFLPLALLPSMWLSPRRPCNLLKGCK